MGEESPTVRTLLKTDATDGMVHFTAKTVRKHGSNAMVVLENIMQGKYGKRFLNVLDKGELLFILIYM